MLVKNGIKISTMQDTSPYDNAIAERINGILKNEFGIENLAAQLVKESVHAYNQIRPHLSNHMLTPDQMHNQTQFKRRQCKIIQCCSTGLSPVSSSAVSSFPAILSLILSTA